ncbi:hypothetical protein N8000_02410 [Rhodospirillales bacterium]|nr:hypothetical protein [Rhodospirillales bacterium]MDC1213318.1 hypothetical protein [Rhodospirillales bacterium]
MLSDPKTFTAMIAGLIDENPKSRRPSKPSRTRPSRYEGSMGGEQLAVLLSMGLTDRDLDYMGPKQRATVEDVIGLHTRKSAAA